MALFRKKKTIKLNPLKSHELAKQRDTIPDDMVSRCPHCHRIMLRDQMSETFVCPHCKEHLQFPAVQRAKWITNNHFEEWDRDMSMSIPYEFPGYQEKLEKARKDTGLREAILVGKGWIDQLPFALGIMDSRFLMASMGTVVGEKLTRLFERATKEKLPVVLFVASGGARMQESILSLMQMAKVTQAVSEHDEAGLFFCSVLTHPTTGGVTASFAMQADIILAEPHATVGFAGKRVIQQNINSPLPQNFQRAESVLENGFIDRIVPRSSQHQVLNLLLKIHTTASK